MAKNVLIHTRSLNIPGGKQTYLLALEDYFKNDFSYFFYGTQQPVKESKLAFVKRFISDYIKFYRLLKKEEFDVVHINTSFNFKSYFRDSIFTLISKMLGNKTVVYWHGWNMDFEKKYADKIVPYFHFTFGKADVMVCLANEFSDKLKAYRYKKPIYTETTVVADSIMKYSEYIDNADSKTFSGLGQNNILFLSRVERVKGIYETIDSFQSLQNRHPNLTLTIAGTGGELENAENYVKEKKLGGVAFLGWIEGDEKLKALRNCDIFVLATYHGEGMPIAVLEAMAMGKPVITTDLGAIKDFFEDGKMGLKVKTRDSKDLENKLEQLIAQPELMKRMGSYNILYAKERFSPELVSERLENIYEDAMNEPTRS